MNITNLDAHEINNGKESARGIAATIVAIAHAYGLFVFPFLGPDNYFGKLLGVASHQAVMIFFVISGYLITQSILNNVKRNEKFDFIEYISSRLARIYPPLIFAVFLSFFFLGIIKIFNFQGVDSSLPFGVGNFQPSRKVFLITLEDVGNVVMMRNGMLEVNGPLWSLYIEWRIYIVMGVLAFLVTSKKIISKIIISMIFLYVVNALLFVNEHAFFYLLVWLIGAAFSVMPSIKKLLIRKCGFFIFLLLSAVIIIWAILSPSIILASGNKFGLFEDTYQLLICIFWCFLIIPDHKFKLRYFNTFLVWLGNLSYSLYILHFPIMLFVLAICHRFVQGSLDRSMQVALFSLILAIAISRLSSKFFENKKYFQKIVYRILIYLVLLAELLSKKFRTLINL